MSNIKNWIYKTIIYIIGDGTNKSNSNNTKKNESVSGNTENKRTLLITAETGSDPEDEGQWLTQGSKQVCAELFDLKRTSNYEIHTINIILKKFESR